MTTPRSIAIMQPTYLPWVGYFALIDRVDTFVFLDSVQFERRSWQQRNRIKTPNGVVMLTVPVRSKGKREQSIVEVEIDAGPAFPDKHVRALELAYRKAPRFADSAPEVLGLLASGTTSLAELNIGMIRLLCERFGITADFRRSSEMDVSGAKDVLLAEICAALGASDYVSPPGSRGYLDGSPAFAEQGISIRYHDYEPVEYRQLYPPFEPYMAAVDLLFNEGPALDVIRAGIGAEKAE